jgi:hypothetical protein
LFFSDVWCLTTLTRNRLRFICALVLLLTDDRKDRGGY